MVYLGNSSFCVVERLKVARQLYGAAKKLVQFDNEHPSATKRHILMKAFTVIRLIHFEHTTLKRYGQGANEQTDR